MIYKPRGRAGEYADQAANLYLGCSHHCHYCYGARVLHMSQEEFDNPKPKKDVLERLEQSAHALDKRGQHVQVLLSFVCDDYQPLDAETNITRNAIEILHKYGHNFCILTKGGTRALRDIDLYRPGDTFACTLTCLEVKDSLRWEPGAATPADRLVALETFHLENIDTWVSLEPVINPTWTLRLIKLTANWVNKYKVGKLNYQGSLPPDLQEEVKGVNWKQFAWNVEDLLVSLSKDYMLKEDLLKLKERQ